MDQTEWGFSQQAWAACFGQMESCLGQALSAVQRDHLQQFSQLLLQTNRQFNLMGPSVATDLLTRHFLDAIPLFAFFSGQAQVADLGSGGGVPGLVLAILCQPPQSLHLIESIHKKARFLERVIDVLGLGDRARVFAQRAEQLGAAQKNAYDLVISRAVGSLAYGAELAYPLLRPGGAYLALKGRNHKEDTAQLARSPVGRLFQPPQIHPAWGEDGGVIVRMNKAGVS
ncbi:MAG: 16S rRNA (guanine(527)-N(7))-methyltransferase RsmG [Magnetococcales bacterium]|nr:16S rRNA (guanine(527)-N(7))-methyltransferase RsmG [Magnetococcales bacterium]